MGGGKGSIARQLISPHEDTQPQLSGGGGEYSQSGPGEGQGTGGGHPLQIGPLFNAGPSVKTGPGPSSGTKIGPPRML